MTDIRLLYVTTKDVSQAREIARTLLDRRLIACANILPQMESIYRWKGQIESGTESVLILKTEERLVDEVTQAVHELHSYEIPCVLSLNVEAGAGDYIDWLKSEVR
jgi:periplasmic divalent cation tolerance protein